MIWLSLICLTETCWQFKDISKRPSLTLRSALKLIRFAEKSPTGWAQLRNMSLMSLLKILKMRRSFEQLSDMHLPRSNRSQPNLPVKGCEMFPNPNIFKLHTFPGSSASAASLPLSPHSNFCHPFHAIEVQPSDISFSCNQHTHGHWANLPACPLF